MQSTFIIGGGKTCILFLFSGEDGFVSKRFLGKGSEP
jgi:hypothetical protein